VQPPINCSFINGCHPEAQPKDLQLFFF